MESCVFCSIVKNNTPHHEIWYEDENHIAFLNKFPRKRAHSLVIPKKHTDNITDLSENEYVELFRSVYKSSKILKKYTNATRISIQVDGYSVGHVHVHLLATFKSGDMPDMPMYELKDGEMSQIGDELRSM